MTAQDLPIPENHRRFREMDGRWQFLCSATTPPGVWKYPEELNDEEHEDCANCAEVAFRKEADRLWRVWQQKHPHGRLFGSPEGDAVEKAKDNARASRSWGEQT